MAFVPGWGLGGATPPQWLPGGGGVVQGVGPSVQPTPPPPQAGAPPSPGFNPVSGPVSTGPSAFGGPTSGYGMQNPYHIDNWPVERPPAAPTAEQTRDFFPPILSSPYVNTINNAQNQANWFGMATPAAAAFQNQLYGPGMTDMEQTYAGAAAGLGARQLGQTHNRLANMFENSTSHGNLAPAMLDATNQYNMQMNQMIGQMGTQRQQMAANLMPFTAGFPIQAGQAGMQGAQGLYDMAQNMMYGDWSFPLAVIGSNPVALPTTVVS